MQERRRERLDRGVKVRSDSIYAVSSMKEILFLAGPGIALVAILLILPLLLPPYWQRVVTVTGVYALLSISFGFLANFVGLVNLGGALFVGVGGYIAGILNSFFGLPIALTMPVAAIAGALICTVVFLPCLPLRGVYFAIVSFVYPLVIVMIISATGVFGGTDGIAGLDVLPNMWVSQYLIILVVLGCMFGISRLVNYKDAGLVFRGVKDNEQAIRASALNITWYKAQAVFIAAAMGCFGGAFLTHIYGWVGMSLFAMDFSILPLAATAVGGSTTIYGPFVGALILVPVSESLRSFGTLRIVFYSVILVFCVVFWTEGVVNYLRRKYEQFERWVRV